MANFVSYDNAESILREYADKINEQQTIMRKNGAINYLPINGTSGSGNGLTWTVNSDGSIKLNGTATADTVIALVDNCTIDVDAFRSTNKIVLASTGADIANVGTLTISGVYKRTMGEIIINTPFYCSVFSSPYLEPVTEKTTDVLIADGIVKSDVMGNWGLTVTVSNGASFDNAVIYTMLVAPECTDFTYAPYTLTNKQITNQIKDVNVAKEIENLQTTDDNLRLLMRKNGAMNFLPITCESGSKNGVTWTVNSDGSITLNGTATANFSLSVLENTMPIDIHTLFNETGVKVRIYSTNALFKSSSINYISGTLYYNNPQSPSPVSDMELWQETPNSQYYIEHEFDALVESSTKQYEDSMSVNISIKSGAVFDNNVIYAMMVQSSCTDYTYVPYAYPNRYLTKELGTTVDTVKTNNNNIHTILRKNGAKNVLPINCESGESNNITWTVNDDGTLTINGTASDDVAIKVLYLGGSATGAIPLSEYDLMDYNSNGYDMVMECKSGHLGYMTLTYSFDAGVIIANGTILDEDYSKLFVKRDTLDMDFSQYSEFEPNVEELYINIPSGESFDNSVVSLMMVLSADTNNTYAPYALTNKQITDKLKNGTGGASSMAQLTDVDLTGLSTNDVLVYMAELGKWVVESGHVVTIALSQEAHDALTPTQQIDPHYFYVITDATDVDVDINDNSVAPDKVWSSEKVNNLVKVNTFEVSTIGWVEDVISQSGVLLYKKQVSLNHVYVESPSIDIGSASGSVLPTTAQQEAYDLVQYVTVDTTVSCLYLYASDIPTDGFYINVEGVD